MVQSLYRVLMVVVEIREKSVFKEQSRGWRTTVCAALVAARNSLARTRLADDEIGETKK